MNISKRMLGLVVLVSMIQAQAWESFSNACGTAQGFCSKYKDMVYPAAALGLGWGALVAGETIENTVKTLSMDKWAIEMSPDKAVGGMIAVGTIYYGRELIHNVSDNITTWYNNNIAPWNPAKKITGALAVLLFLAMVKEQRVFTPSEVLSWGKGVLSAALKSVNAEKLLERVTKLTTDNEALQTVIKGIANGTIKVTGKTLTAIADASPEYIKAMNQIGNQFTNVVFSAPGYTH